MIQMIRKKGWIIAAFILFSCIFMPAAQTSAAPCDLGESVLGVPTWYKYFDGDSDESGRCSVVLPTTGTTEGNPDTTDWAKVVGYVAIAATEILLRIAALVAVGYIIYGGYRYILSQGDPESAKSARQTIINALIGLVIAIASASIVHFVANRLTTPAPQQRNPSNNSGNMRPM